MPSGNLEDCGATSNDMVVEIRVRRSDDRQSIMPKGTCGEGGGADRHPRRKWEMCAEGHDAWCQPYLEFKWCTREKEIG